MSKTMINFYCNKLGVEKIIRNLKNLAFTLAEVLIILGIIGIVAEMTIPNLIYEYQKQLTATKLKSTFAILNNAIDMAKVDYGNDINMWAMPNSSYSADASYFTENYLLPYVKTINICGASIDSICSHRVEYIDGSSSYTISGTSNSYSFTLQNGAVISIWLWTLGPTVKNSRVTVWIDINGFERPNVMGKDTFLIELGSGSGDKNKFVPYGIAYTREELLSTTNGVRCNKTTGSGNGCMAVIVKDGWQIADGYPWD